MSVTLGPNYVSGITTATNSTDVAFKEYADNKPGVTIPDTAGNTGKLLFTDGSTLSWEVAATYQEYDTAGSYSFSIPSRARKLTIEASGAGGGWVLGMLPTENMIGKKLWNNGKVQVKSNECPGEEFSLGSLQLLNKNRCWWTNGIDSIRSKNCPGEGWYRGHSIKIENRCTSKGTI